MFDITKIQDCLFDLIGWKNTLNKCETPLNPILETSLTGQYYNNTHALLVLENLQAIAPNKNDFNYPLWDSMNTYNTGDVVIVSGLFYKSLIDSNIANPPTISTDWQEIYPFSEWLTNRTRQSIADFFNSVFVSKNLQQQAKTLLADSTIYDASMRNTSEIGQGRFVGFSLTLGNYKNLKLVIDKIGLHFSGNVTNLPFYVYHSSQTDAIYTTTLTTVRNSNFSWLKLAEPITVEYWSELVNTGGVFYFGYYENDLPLGVQALNNVYNLNGPCGSCAGTRNARMKWDRYRRFAFFSPLAVPSTALNVDKTLWEGNYTQTINDRTYGLNLSFSIQCDVTDIICKNKFVFTNALIKQVQRDFANYMLNTNATNELANRLRKQALLELSDEGGKLEMKLMQEMKAISLDLSDLDTPCCPEQPFKGVRYGAI